MPHLQFVTLDVFTSSPFTGNPLVIIFLSDDSNPSQEQKQNIAREFNLSETLFIHDSKDKKRRIDIFTTECEIPFAGHPTIGAATWCLQHSTKQVDHEVDTLITKSGEIPISLSSKGDGKVSARVAHNVRIHGSAFPNSELLRLHPSLGPYVKDAKSTFPIFSIVNGMSQVHVELPSLSAMEAVTTAAGGEILYGDKCMYLDEGWRNGLVILYFYVRDVADPQSGKKVIRTRAILGNLEDPATGSAASGLASYLSLMEGRAGEYQYDIVQGVEMGRRSEIGIGVTVNGETKIETVELKGSAVKVSEGSIVLPE
ncbi:phenazine biosynthesis protein [Aspergillus sclerotialis]|uniref:Phenazine biosynthesis protein n=1 Tax=Aspergillus sclerotialis TaxID=2070753 RepID=A0A3A2ZW77_9EURO|nr:phenazine biosynthesis protein [Aspergillus sclerotialis]